MGKAASTQVKGSIEERSSEGAVREQKSNMEQCMIRREPQVCEQCLQMLLSKSYFS